MKWLLVALFISPAPSGTMTVTTIQIESEELCANAIKTLSAAGFKSVDGKRVFIGATCIEVL